MLEGIKVLDLTQALAGPYGSLLLGDLGAEIIKIESSSGDFTRTFTAVAIEGVSAYYLSINRNKKSVVLDLKTEKDLNIFYELVKTADVVYDNFRPGVVERLRIDYETLKEINPQIICCSISGYGHTGPEKDRPAFDLVIQAISGEMSITGEPGRPPVRMGIPMGDLAGGQFAALGICAALVERQRTGTGQKIDLSLLDSQISLMTYVGQYYFANGVIPGPSGSGHQTTPAYRAFQTKDRWLVVACMNDNFWAPLCEALGLPELIDDPRFKTGNDRFKNRYQIDEILEKRFATKSADEWLSILKEANVPYGPVNDLKEALSDPQVLAREMIIEVEHEKLGRFKMIGNPIKSTSLAKTQAFTPPPLLGEHTEQVLKSIVVQK